MNNHENLRALIRDVPDFPKPGIMFKDITPLLADTAAFRIAIGLLGEEAKRQKPDVIVGIESRGFIFAAAVADRIGVGFVPVRKPGKLPYKSIRETYALEYGSDSLELHEDAVRGKRCWIVDDVLATGGTAAATGRLIARAAGNVAGFGFLIDLTFLQGRSRLAPHAVYAALSY